MNRIRDGDGVSVPTAMTGIDTIVGPQTRTRAADPTDNNPIA